MTKEQEFKQRFVAVLKDLQQNGSKDKEAMWLLGSLASDLADDLKVADWSAAKRGMRLDIAAGTAVRFEPGQAREVRLIPLSGARKVYGFRQQVMGPVDE